MPFRFFLCVLLSAFPTRRCCSLSNAYGTLRDAGWGETMLPCPTACTDLPRGHVNCLLSFFNMARDSPRRRVRNISLPPSTACLQQRGAFDFVPEGRAGQALHRVRMLPNRRPTGNSFAVPNPSLPESPRASTWNPSIREVVPGPCDNYASDVLDALLLLDDSDEEEEEVPTPYRRPHIPPLDLRKVSRNPRHARGALDVPSLAKPVSLPPSSLELSLSSLSSTTLSSPATVDKPRRLTPLAVTKENGHAFQAPNLLTARTSSSTSEQWGQDDSE
eukprot:Sspe_Gene.67543::Locus_39849_Transcript_1_1_Confidence_1.000_Length_1925::g.67543::m.67543